MFQNWLDALVLNFLFLFNLLGSNPVFVFKKVKLGQLNS